MSENKETKNCPYCGEEILTTAKKCRYCGEFLDGSQKQQSIVTQGQIIPYNKYLTIECSICGYEGKPKKITPGSIWIEIVLWLFLIIPGVVYTIWRLTTQKKCQCPKCGNSMLIIKNHKVK